MTREFIACRIFLYIYFSFAKGLNNQIGTSIRALFSLMGAQGGVKNYKRLKSYSTLCETIQWFIDNGYVKIISDDDNEFSISDFKYNQLITFQIIEEHFGLSTRIDSGKEKINEPFLIVTQSEFESILNSNTSNKTILLYMFVYIKSCMSWRTNEIDIDKYPRCAFLTNFKISVNTGYSGNSVTEYIKELCDINVIARKQLKRHEYLSADIKPPYIYTATAFPNWENELEYGVRKFNIFYHNAGIEDFYLNFNQE